MIFRRRTFLMLGLAAALALTGAASASAAKLDLETPHLGNVLGEQLIAKGHLEIFHGGGFAGGCFGQEAFGEYLVTSAAKDSAAWEPDCEVMTGTGTLQLSAKKATLSAAMGTMFGFAVPRGEECAWEAAKMKGPVTSLSPVTIHLSATAKRFPGGNPTCAKKALVEAEYVLWAAEPPSRSFEEPVTGVIVK
jgi:hypothetical protein